MDIRKLIITLAVGLLILVSITGGALADRIFGFRPLDNLVPRTTDLGQIETNKILREDSLVIDVVDRVSPSVVTVSIQTPKRKVLEFSPFGGFRQREQGGEQDIGTGFVVSADGLIITNKHVVSNTTASYKVITKDNKEYEIRQISRDPSNDLAILKIDSVIGDTLAPIELGDSSNLKVGQFAIAIGTALGEFRNTVTTGVISGLGRGIQAGNAYEGFVEQLDNIIQTDAAINPGNSGGPLLNSAGQVIGVNVAVAQGAQNIGFAIPVNIVKDSLNQFKTEGKFLGKPFLGVQYQMIDQQTSITSQVPQGAYIVDVVEGSPAESARLKSDDIITFFDGKALKDEADGLAGLISKKKVGDSVALEVWRDGQIISLQVTLTEGSQ
ncbi:trypsin-like peptidase domain-containing protein [Candidatus Microgenomates bacterium]|nr:trypsin-like peptidase domain-containing protein [Candidatus Microgenomates bacterium]